MLREYDHDDNSGDRVEEKRASRSQEILADVQDVEEEEADVENDEESDGLIDDDDSGGEK